MGGGGRYRSRDREEGREGYCSDVKNSGSVFLVHGLCLLRYLCVFVYVYACVGGGGPRMWDATFVPEEGGEPLVGGAWIHSLFIEKGGGVMLWGCG